MSPAPSWHPATLPPPGLAGLEPAWSRLVTAADGAGSDHTWHVLDSHAGVDAADVPERTLLCVHGNPTWSYLWRGLVQHPPAGWRVVAVDQLGMGWSERPEGQRTLAQRVEDLGGLTAALALTGPVVTVAHDWGGPVSLGWALAHRDQLAGVVLTNTAVAQAADGPDPLLIRLAHAPALRDTACVRTPLFVRATTALSRPALARPVRRAFAAPYATASLRAAVGGFVADIPFAAGHPSRPTLERIAAGLDALADAPVLLLWGPRDPVFADRYLRDLRRRLPHADVHRYEGASHLVLEDAPQAAADIARWVGDLPGRAAVAGAGPLPTGQVSERPALWAALAERAADRSPAVVEMTGGRRVSWSLLATRVDELASGLVRSGVRPGDRVALLVPPGADLTAAVYACWRAGAVIVVADAGLGLAGMGRALRGAGAAHVIGTRKGLVAAQLMRVPGRRILAGIATGLERRALGAQDSLAGLARLGRALPTSLPISLAMSLATSLPAPAAGDECAVVFTSGATGPAKGVVYRHGQVQAQVAALRELYGITPDDRFVAAFAPFALYGPALGIASAVPNMDVTAPGTLTAAALADAVGAVDASLVFASPAALVNVVATVDALTPAGRAALDGVRLVMSAGAPVPASLLREVTRLMPKAGAHTPYGMTEALPVADVSLDQLEDAGPGEGVCVGRPLPGVAVGISPLGGEDEGEPLHRAGVTGEVLVRADHVKDRYDQLWSTERAASRTAGWHRTGDVGHFDDDGRLWVEGRLVHVVHTAAGPVTPVGPERRIEDLAPVRAAAVVGVGPVGTQQVVVALVPAAGTRRARQADPPLTDAVRAAAGVPVAAVLLVPALPVDVRHASKVDRTRLGRWAGEVLAGGRLRRP